MNGSSVFIIHRLHCTALSNVVDIYSTELMRIGFFNRNTQQHNFRCKSQQDMIYVDSQLYSIPYSRNIGVELNLVFGKINFVLPNFILSTFNTCIENSKCLYILASISKHFFKKHKYYNVALYKFSKSISSIKVPADLVYENIVAKCAWLSEAR